MEPVTEENSTFIPSLTIIGGGPGGYEAAMVAAKLGARVTLVERQGVGGAAVLTTSALAGDPALRTDAGKGISHGANLLVAAEGLTALRAALAQHYRGKRKQGARLVGAAETGALVVGHLLLIDGLCRTR